VTTDKIASLFNKAGTAVVVSGNQPLLLDQPDAVWMVLDGPIEVSSVPLKEGVVAGTRNHLFSADARSLLFGMDLEDSDLGLLATGTVGSELIQLDFERLLKEAQKDAHLSGNIVQFLDTWVENISSVLTEAAPPQRYEPLEANTELELLPDGIVRPRNGVVWTRHISGHSSFIDRSIITIDSDDGFAPLSSTTWFKAEVPSHLQVKATRTILDDDAIEQVLQQFHQLALDCLHLNERARAEGDQRRLQERSASDQLLVEGTLSQLALSIQPEATAHAFGDTLWLEKEDALLAACRLVGRNLDIDVHPQPGLTFDGHTEQSLSGIAAASRIRIRQVVLRGEWWREDSGPLLAFTSDDAQPIALIPPSAGKYEIANPVDHSVVPVTPDVAALVDPVAHIFYRGLPEREATRADLIRFAIRGQRRDALTILLTAIAAGLLALIIPLATAAIFNSVIPSGNSSQLLAIGLVLIVAALSKAAFDLAQKLAILRLDGQIGVSVQAAIWDRLLRLPVTFFRGYTAGDLTERAMGIDTIRRQLTAVAISAVLAGIFSVFNFALLFYFDASLAMVAALLALIAVIATGLTGRALIKHERKLARLHGEISGLLLQLIGGIAKLRVAGAEGRAFSVWGRKFGAQKLAAFQARTVVNYLAVFNAAFPIITAMAVFYLTTFSDRVQMSTGDFLAFYSALTLFLSAAVTLGATLPGVLRIIPTYERVEPILKAVPEVDASKTDPGILSGAIDVSNVSFRYDSTGPLIIKNVKLQVNPGEFVALVGPSGSGKSTLLRLLLGFEIPEMGTIYYNGQDLNGVDIRGVRRQIGVVLQTSQVAPATIYQNIVGTSSIKLTIDNAWEAAELAGLEQDIRQMPMGMHTFVSEGGTTLSGGQRQRLLIARAIVNKPRIIFFDEATSALDNRTQAVVSQSLEELDATRIVIAHRLSTIVNADRIYVLKDGELLQSGTYGELVNKPGLFAELSSRQLVE
jgi:NHLM bacteriocin system ABC transporter ATP-binding protein